jgi:hypothetical protein
VPQDYTEIFFRIITDFINLEIKQLILKFEDFKNKINEEAIPEILDYCNATAFICDTPIRNEDLIKKKTGQYIKYKTIPKWHHYAWDMIK